MRSLGRVKQSAAQPEHCWKWKAIINGIDGQSHKGTFLPPKAKLFTFLCLHHALYALQTPFSCFHGICVCHNKPRAFLSSSTRCGNTCPDFVCPWESFVAVAIFPEWLSVQVFTKSSNELVSE